MGNVSRSQPNDEPGRSDHREVPGGVLVLAHRMLLSPQWVPDASRLVFFVRLGATSWVEVVDARTGLVIHTSDLET
jgi:hypothetical protein